MLNCKCIFRDRVAYFAMGSRSASECRQYAKKVFPWMDLAIVSPTLGLVAVFADYRDFIRFCDFYTS